MKILLTAINSKYIHSNLAVYSLRAYANEYAKNIVIKEYTINHQIDYILQEIYKNKPDVIALSCYIWNVEYIKELIGELSKILPQCPIWLGGPEVSYDAISFLEKHTSVTGIMVGEGEKIFHQVVQYYVTKEIQINEITGIVYRNSEGNIVENLGCEFLNMDEIPFVYKDLKEFENRIIYYETSRGCPFSCSYCLSSIDKRVRFRSFELVKKELQFFLDNKVKQVKFVDRTFNCWHKHAIEIWTYIKEHDNDITNFHFEVSADIINQEEIKLLSTLRPGLIQLEIGVQSTNAQTILEICRTMDFEKLSNIVIEINGKQNIHQHLDLIAGLPYEDFESFQTSFNQVYALEPEQLQMGFLKVLKGSKMYEKAQEYELQYKNKPPYEVLSTKWLSYEDILELKAIEEMVEVYYNSGQFNNTIRHLVKNFENPFKFYKTLSCYYEGNGLNNRSHSRINQYDILLGFVKEYISEQVEFFRELLTYDLYLREKMKSRPLWANELGEYKEEIRNFYIKEEQTLEYLKDYEGYSYKQLAKMTHIECFKYNVKAKGEKGQFFILFDYKKRNPLSNEAETQFVPILGLV
jgi:Fe-S oxidoreductase